MNNLESLVVPSRWTLDDALGLIRALQQSCRKYGFHLCLGGGVLNTGASEKDLDLYFLPMGGNVNKPYDLVRWLESMWGTSDILGQSYPMEKPYLSKFKFQYGAQRIDVFILGEPQLEKEKAVEEVEEKEDVAEGPFLYPDRDRVIQSASRPGLSGIQSGYLGGDSPEESRVRNFWRSQYFINKPSQSVQFDNISVSNASQEGANTGVGEPAAGTLYYVNPDGSIRVAR